MIEHLSFFLRSMVIAGLELTTKMISPNFSLGSIDKPGLLMTILSEYSPGAIIMILLGSAALMASYIDLYGPLSLSIIHHLS